MNFSQWGYKASISGGANRVNTSISYPSAHLSAVVSSYNDGYGDIKIGIDNLSSVLLWAPGSAGDGKNSRYISLGK